jgi:hypothetical protein
LTLGSITLKTAGRTATNGTSAASASVAVTAGRLYIVAVFNIASNSGQMAAVTGISGAGTTWTKQQDLPTDPLFTNLSVWRGVAPSTTSGALTFTAPNTMDTWHWVVLEDTTADTGGTNGSNAFVQSATNTNAAATTLAATLGSAFGNASNYGLAFFGWDSDSLSTAASATAGGSWTELSDGGQNETGYSSALQCQWINGTADTSADVTWTASASLGAIVFEIKALPAATPSMLPRPALNPAARLATLMRFQEHHHVGHLHSAIQRGRGHSATRPVRAGRRFRKADGDPGIRRLTVNGGWRYTGGGPLHPGQERVDDQRKRWQRSDAGAHRYLGAGRGLHMRGEQHHQGNGRHHRHALFV